MTRFAKLLSCCKSCFFNKNDKCWARATAANSGNLGIWFAADKAVLQFSSIVLAISIYTGVLWKKTPKVFATRRNLCEKIPEGPNCFKKTQALNYWWSRWLKLNASELLPASHHAETLRVCCLHQHWNYKSVDRTL